MLSGLERDTVEQLVLRGVAGGDPPTKADIRACEKRLELVDGTLLDSLRDALRCAALAAREVSPENA